MVSYDLVDTVSQGSQRLENLENQNGHGKVMENKVMEHAKLAKCPGILLSAMEFFPILPQNYREFVCFSPPPRN